MALPGDQEVRAARMVRARFARPGEGEDVLTSRTEVKKTGGVLASVLRPR